MVVFIKKFLRKKIQSLIIFPLAFLYWCGIVSQNVVGIRYKKGADTSKIGA